MLATLLANVKAATYDTCDQLSLLCCRVLAKDGPLTSFGDTLNSSLQLRLRVTMQGDIHGDTAKPPGWLHEKQNQDSCA